MGESKLGRGMVTVLIANICNLGFSILTSFLLPKFLSVDTYASIKTFQLYAGYVGLFHLGYVDGMYIRNGGKELKDLTKIDLEKSISTLRITEVVISVALLIGVLFYRDKVFLAFVLCVIPLNMTAYFQYLFQAVGEFKRYSKIVRMTAIATFAVNMVLLFIVNTDNDSLYLIGYIIIYYIIWIILEIEICKICGIRTRLALFELRELTTNIKNGILLTLGNLSSFLFTSMDRWFVKALLSTADFAQYSFAVSIEHFVNVAMTPISVTLYNFFCRVTDIDKIKKIRNYVMIFSVAVIAVGFPAKFILEHYLETYIEANDIIFYLFSAQIFYFQIKCIYVNLYKAREKQRTYFIKLVIAIFSGAAFNALCFIVLHNKEAMAIGTVLSAITWWLLCLPDFKELKYKVNEIIYMFLQLLAFNACGVFFNSIVGFVAYVIFTIILSLLLMRKDTLGLLKYGRGMLKQFIVKNKRKDD